MSTWHGAAGRIAHVDRSKGYSLIELMVVLAIMATLASIGMPLAELAKQRNKEEELRRSLRTIRTALDRYKQLVDLGKIERASDGSGYPPTLAVLTEGVTDISSPRGRKIYLLRQLPRDPFAQGESLDAGATWALRSYESPPGDPRPGKDVFDVRSSSPLVGLNGIPYREW